MTLQAFHHLPSSTLRWLEIPGNLLTYQINGSKVQLKLCSFRAVHQCITSLALRAHQHQPTASKAHHTEICDGSTQLLYRENNEETTRAESL